MIKAKAREKKKRSEREMRNNFNKKIRIKEKKEMN